MWGDRYHNRRKDLVYSKYTFDGLDYVVRRGYEDIAIFEKKFGYPTDIDAVWENREKLNRGTNIKWDVSTKTA